MDSEFRKPYEYEEEKRGLIVLFVVTILAIDILQTLYFAAQEYKYLGHIPILGGTFLIIGSLFIIYIIYTAVVVFRMKDNFVFKAKQYVVIRVIYSVINFLIVFYNIVTKEELIGDSQDQYLEFGRMLLVELVVPLIFIISFSLVWFLYFTYSRRCRRKGK